MTPDPAITAAFEATWPAAEYADAGGFTVGRGMGAGGRVGSARPTGTWTVADIAAAIAIQREWDQPALFRVGDDDTALADALAAQGLNRHTPTAILSAPVAALSDRTIPEIMTFDVWPPMAIQRSIWQAGNIGPARLAVMERAPMPKTAILGRMEDRAAGAAFAAVHAGVVVVHAVEVLPFMQRRGLAGWMMRLAAVWGAANGVDRVALAVGRANEPALALYQSLGFAEVGGYAYWQSE